MSVWSRLRALSVRTKALLALVIAALVGVGIWLVFFWFAFQTILFDDKVDEAPPVFASGAVAGETDATDDAPPADTADEASDVAPPADTADEASSDEGIPGDELTEEQEAAMQEAMEEEGIPAEQSVEESMPDMPVVRVEASGSFINRSHPTSGTAEVLGDGTGQRFLRFEDFRTDNGPDLNVYLSPAPVDAPAGAFDDDFVDLGDLKGNIGPQNYEISPDVDLDRYSTVVIWCVRFSVVFGVAPLTPA